MSRTTASGCVRWRFRSLAVVLPFVVLVLVLTHPATGTRLSTVRDDYREPRHAGDPRGMPLPTPRAGPERHSKRTAAGIRSLVLPGPRLPRVTTSRTETGP